MRLIDADNLKNHIPSTKVDIFENCRNCQLLDDWQVIDIINNMPTIDPVRHGHWISCDEYPYNNRYRCSCCGDEFVLFDGTPLANNYNCCPNCGAKMDEKIKNDD